ncbi:hypothetical protein NE237_001251 [Protea cynaroides]|uniref:ABC1 atypical kinase-like domain-containing protein n=1 Tax=Protea cynaroides TaxID=273540 RepID=A0A9Q0KSY6_9MAGN|nr:hypothetical protein NE237_001251 [Protea cynaroides]
MDVHMTPKRLCFREAPLAIGLSGMDLFLADLKALEAYGSYFYHLSKIWSRPLPEVYNPEEIAEYFSCRPHLVALRLIEVYRGVMLGGSNVAVKVQRTDLLHVVVLDIYILWLGLVLQNVVKRKSDPWFYADELGRGLVEELDYTREAANAYEFLVFFLQATQMGKIDKP